MNQDYYVVIGQYRHKKQEASTTVKELITHLQVLGEVNVFDMPHTEFGDEMEYDDHLRVHHYTCPNGDVANASQRVQEMVRDIVLLGAKECYLDYGVADIYLPIVKSIHTALQKYRIKVYCLNKPTFFRLFLTYF